jgi:integrase
MAKTKFTAGRVDSFTCDGGKIPSFLWDSAAPGLGLRAAPGGGKAFIFQAKLKGQVIRITIGDPKTWTIVAAQAEARRLKVIIDNGQDPRHVKAAGLAAEQAARDVKAAADSAAAAAAVRDALTVGEAWTVYLATRRSKWGDRHYLDHVDKAKAGGEVSKRGTRGRGKTIDGPLYPLMSLRLRDLDAATVEAWAEKEALTRPTAARLAWRLLKVFLTWCAEQKDYAPIVSPINSAKTKKTREALGKPQTKDDVLQRSQLPDWFAAARKLSNPIMAACLQIILITGARPGEVLEMRWEDVNTKWKGITIRDKVEGEREIPLTPYLESLLVALPRRNEWVFAGVKDAHITSPNSQLASVCKVAGIEGLTLHGLRRSFKSLSEWLEIPAGVVAQIMGHKPSATAEKHYTIRPLDLLRLHHEKIEAWMLMHAGVQFTPAAPGLRVVAG